MELNIHCPVNRASPLNRGLITWLMAMNVPPYSNGKRFLDLNGKNHATFVGSPTWGSGKTIYGATSALTTPEGSGFQIANTITTGGALTVFMRGTFPAAFGTNKYWFDGRLGTGTYCLLEFDSIDGINYGGNILYGSITSLAGQPFSMAVVDNGTNATGYINGLAGSTTASTNTNIGANLRIGLRAAADDSSWQGTISEFRIFNIAKPADEILRLHHDARSGHKNSLNWTRPVYARSAGGGGGVAPRSLIVSQALNFSTNW